MQIRKCYTENAGVNNAVILEVVKHVTMGSILLLYSNIDYEISIR